MAQALASIRTVLSCEFVDGSGTFTTVANVGSINGVSFSSNVVDVSSHSTSDDWRRKIVTLLEQEDLTFDLYWDPTESTHGATSDAGIVDLMVNKKLRSWRFIANDSGNFRVEFEAYVSKFGLTAPVDGVYTAAMTLTPTGAPTITP